MKLCKETVEALNADIYIIAKQFQESMSDEIQKHALQSHILAYLKNLKHYGIKPSDTSNLIIDFDKNIYEPFQWEQIEN